MKKSVSVVIAILLTLAAVLTVSVAAFAAEISPETATTKAAEVTVPTVVATTPTTAAAKPATTLDPRRADEATSASIKADNEAAEKAAKEASSRLAEIQKQIENMSTKPATTLPNSTKLDDAEVVPLADGQTAIYDGPETTAKGAGSGAKTTKKAAAVSTRVPNTGSSAIVPAFAVLALIAGTVAVVKTKKNEI